MESFVGKICPYCKTQIGAGEAVKVCPDCGIAHHEACWTENHGCTTFGCAQMNSVPEQSAPAAENAFCVKCGAALAPGSAFCVKCGAPAGASAPAETAAAGAGARVYPAVPLPVSQPSAPAVAPTQQNEADPASAAPGINMPEIVVSVLGILGSILSVIFAFVTYGMSTGSYESNTQYGGDAYTGIQNAAAQTARNLVNLSDIVKFGLGSILLILGICGFCFFVLRFIKANNKIK